MKRSLFCVILLILGLPSLVFGLEVRFRESAVARSRMLTLEDVAEIRPSSREKQLGKVVLFAAPGPGERICYKSGTLKAYVQRAVSETAHIEWAGARSVCVRQEGSLVTPEKLAAVVNERIQQALSHLSARKVGFRFRNRPAPVSVPSGRVSFDVVFSDPDILESRQVTVIIKVDGKVVENIGIAGEAQAFVPVATAAGKMKRGHVLRRADIVARAKNIAELTQPCVDLDAAVGQRLKRPVRTGQVLSKRDLERPVLVKRRQMVTMVLQKGALRIQARGMAASHGRQGEVIPVRNPRSQREVPCRVIGNGRVEVEF